MTFLTTEKFGPLEYDDVIVFYDYPRVFLCKDKDNKKYAFTEFRSDKQTSTWGVCDLQKYNIKKCDENNLKDLIYDYEVVYDYIVCRVIGEKEIEPRKYTEGKFHFRKENTEWN